MTNKTVHVKSHGRKLKTFRVPFSNINIGVRIVRAHNKDEAVIKAIEFTDPSIEEKIDEIRDTEIEEDKVEEID